MEWRANNKGDPAAQNPKNVGNYIFRDLKPPSKGSPHFSYALSIIRDSLSQTHHDSHLFQRTTQNYSNTV